MAFSKSLLLFFFCSFFCLSVVSARPGRHAWSLLHASKKEVFDASMAGSGIATSPPVQLRVEDHQIVIDNGIMQLTLSKPEGRVAGVRYNGIENLLRPLMRSDGGGYWDVDWSGSNTKASYFDVLNAEKYQVIVENENQVEVSFKIAGYSSDNEGLPLNIDKRFVVLRGSSGFYTYAIFEHESSFPGLEFGEARIAFKLNEKMFRYMAMADNRQRVMPLPEDHDPGRCTVLAYKEAVLITKPIDPESITEGQVDDKYQYVIENENNKVHGWISSDPPTGFWMITPSNEFKTGGPLKQDLTSHVGPTTLAIFVSDHYAGDAQKPKISAGEYWKKVFGPVFVYLNSNPDKQNARSLLWTDAKLKMENEVQSWPYSFPAAEDYQKPHQRGTVTGTLMVQDRYVNSARIPASRAYVGLAVPGSPGSWQTESKGYQFWSRADANGSFTIPNVIAGVYNVYAWVPNFIGDYLYGKNITVTPGSTIELPNLVYEPPRDGPTLWEIGVPDRTAAEFFIPDARPEYVNKLYVNHEKYRQYGLWDRYTDLYPERDIVYRVGVSDYQKDWFFAHVTRRVDSNFYQPTTRQIQFNLANLSPWGSYTLRIAIAAAQLSRLEVRVNDPTARPVFGTHLIGRDNAIARHGIHGLYELFTVSIAGDRLKEGLNSIYLTQTTSNVFTGVMYDYIRLEGPEVY